VEEMFGVAFDLEDVDVDTVGGLLGWALGRVPIPGATVSVGGLTFVAESVKGRRNRVGSVLIRRDEQDEKPATTEAAASS